MPQPITDALPTYAAQEIQREDRAMPRYPMVDRGQDVSPMNPYLASLLGGLADTASTYAFLKRGTASEDNALVAGLADKPGQMAGMGAAVNVALPLLLKHTLGKAHPKIAEALAANQGALQMGYGAINTQNTLTPRGPQGDSRNTAKMYRAALLAQLQGDK